MTTAQRVEAARNMEAVRADHTVGHAAAGRVGRRGDPFEGKRPKHGVWEPKDDPNAVKNFGRVNPSNPTSGV